MKLRRDGKSIRAVAQAWGVANTTFGIVPKKKETTYVLTTRNLRGRARKTTNIVMLMANIVRAVS